MSGGRVRSNYWGIRAQRKARRVKHEHAEKAFVPVRAGPRPVYRTRPLAALALAVALTVPLSLSTGTAATKAGVTPGALGVDESGQATYSIPIAVPPGIAGMEPSLSLNFNSGAGNGLLGVGWSVGGLSVIHRCPKTFAQDGLAGGVKYDSNDRFCLDGKRLINVSGGYGAHDTEYRTEVDSFAKVISHGAAATGPDYFTVRTKSGQYMEYGRTTDSRIEAVGRAAVRVWAVNKIRDSAGNYMNFGYTENTANGGYRIAGIDYTINDGAGVAHTNSVNFLYQVRPDVVRGYLGGSLITTDKRLATIRTVTGGATVREYRLAYATSSGPTGRSRLTSVTECDTSGDCLDPTVFTWKANATPFVRKTQYDLPHPIYEYFQRQAEFADVDGDGRQDFVRAFRSDGANNFQDVWLASGAGWVHSPAHQPPFFVANHNIGFPNLGEFVDVNGDGLVDWVESYSRTTNSGVVTERNTWLNTGTGWSLNAGYQPPFNIYNYEYKTYEGAILKEGQFLDVNGDGLVDWVRAIKISVVDKLDGATTQTDYDLRTTWLNTGSGWAVNSTYQPPFVISEEIVTENCFTETFPNGQSSVICGSRQHESKPRGEFVDTNGDNRPDWVQAYKQDSGTFQQTWLLLNNGWQTNVARTAPFVIFDKDEKLGEFVDVNGDGQLDWIEAYSRPAGDFKKTWLNSGTGWLSDTNYAPPFLIADYKNGGQTARGTFIDVNGDGLADRVEAFKDATATHKTTWLSTGTGWQLSATHQLPSHLFDTGRPRGDFVDVSGDGEPDVVIGTKTSSVTSETWVGKPAFPDRVLSISDGLGRTSSIFYTPLTNDDYYSKRSNAVFAVQDIQAPTYVVYKISQDDGVGGQADKVYTYDGAKVDVQGRGFLGFRYVTSEDVQTGIVTTTEYRQDFPYIGQVASTESYLADGTTLKKVDNTFASLPLNGGKTVFPYVSRSIAESFELNDGPGNFSVTTVTTDSTYDSWGNPTQVVVTTTGGGETFTTTTNNTYTNNPVPGKWHLGRLT
ncbi:MAG: hypothetical protein MI806_33460, partial [Minwuiales bacterium]|nr:hypothetical protein [Minwuiales bacterium]